MLYDDPCYVRVDPPESVRVTVSLCEHCRTMGTHLHIRSKLLDT